MRGFFEWGAGRPGMATFVLLAAACAVAYYAPPRIDGIETAASRGKAGYERDYYIVKRGIIDTSRWDRVAIVYGFGYSDFDPCRDFIAGYIAKYPQAEMRCEPAN
jgi:hypothetical protein